MTSTKRAQYFLGCRTGTLGVDAEGVAPAGQGSGGTRRHWEQPVTRAAAIGHAGTRLPGTRAASTRLPATGPAPRTRPVVTRPATTVALVATLVTAATTLACSDDATDPGPDPVATVEISPPTASVDAGDTVRFAARALDAQGNELTNRTISWNSLDPGTAMVDTDGLVTGAAPGTASITAAAESVSDTATVTVLAVAPVVPALALVAEGFSLPTYVTTPPGQAGRLFVTELAGQIHLVEDGARLPTPFLDLTAVTGCCDHSKGLLAMAFHPDYASSGLFYVFFNDLAGHSRLTEYQVSADPDVADAGSGRDLLTVTQQEVAHVGGQVAFGPDGYLYVSFGDGTAAGEADEPRNGQNLGNAYSTLLRLDVDDGTPYGVPADNPFVGQGGALPEIWVYGLRNPWRFSFDRATGDLYIGDVGKDLWEEIDFQDAASPGGENYGWSETEGTDCFREEGCDQSGFEPPLHQYTHAVTPSCSASVTGGYVYRGSALPGLQGLYFWGDFCDSVIRSFRPSAGQAVDHQEWTQLSAGLSGLVSFGEDADGELYVVSFSDGRVYRIAAEE